MKGIIKSFLYCIKILFLIEKDETQDVIRECLDVLVIVNKSL